MKSPFLAVKNTPFSERVSPTPKNVSTIVRASSFFFALFFSSSMSPDGLAPDAEHVPADANIPDNYVSFTLKHEKALPPVGWENIANELNWLHVAILFGTPILGFAGAFFTPLRWQTALWSVLYYYMTGLGKYFFSGAML